MRLFRRRTSDREIDAELRQHLEELIEANLQAGRTDEEARREALAEFGLINSITEECRDTRILESWATFLRDLRFAVRRMCQSPGLTAAIVLSLMLGIGANSVLFSLVNAAILRSIPVHNPRQLVWFDSGSHGRALSYPFYEEIRDDPNFDGVLCAFPTAVNVSASGMAARVDAELVSGNYFAVLGIAPYRGRFLTAADHNQPVAVVSHDFWEARLGGRSEAVGQMIRINNSSWTVVGVTPPGFAGFDLAYRRSLFVPMGMKPQITPGWNGLDKPLIAWLVIAGRLTAGIDKTHLGTQMNARFHAFQERHLAGDQRLSASQQGVIRGRRLHLEPLSHATFGPRVREHIVSLAWVVGLLLALACLNVAGLLLARSLERRKEIATRLSIGASRGRIISQLLTEAMLLALAGGTAGFLAALIIAPVLAARFPLAGDGSQLEVPIDWNVFAFTLLLSLLACLFFGLAPAWRSTQIDLTSALKEAMPTRATNRLRNVVIAVQSAVSIVLVSAAGWFAANLHSLLTRDAGYDRRQLIFAELEPVLSGYDNAARLKLYQALERRLAEDSAWTSATLSSVAPMSQYYGTSLFLVKNREREPDRPVRAVVASPSYFDTLRIPLRSGRLFNSHDHAEAPRSAIISESLARREFPNEDAIGKRFVADLRDPLRTTFEIVGTVADADMTDPRDRTNRECVYFPYRQWPFTLQAVFVQARLAPGISAATAAEHLRQALREIDPTLALYGIRTIEQASEALLAGERLAVLLTSFFGLAAALLFAVGMHGVFSRDFAAKIREVAIRIALGGPAGRILWSIARPPLLAATAGLVFGLMSLTSAASKLAPVVSSIKFTASYFAIPALLLLVLVGLALMGPAWRLRRIQPASVLARE